MEKTQIFKEEKLEIQVEELQNLIKVRWLGQCTLRNPSQFLMPILNDQLTICIKNSKRLVLDFTKTNQMNSSGVIPIIQILKKVKDNRGSVQVLYNNLERWQTVLIGELKLFETEDNRIQVIGIKPT
ncbi:MAG: hypothetical protein KBF93_06815 [Leptospiraceae bacterium]|nr:hypothetical protein [Leptospiraceae bacterium]